MFKKNLKLISEKIAACNPTIFFVEFDNIEQPKLDSLVFQKMQKKNFVLGSIINLIFLFGPSASGFL
jgi:hypothetical protein